MAKVSMLLTEHDEEVGEATLKRLAALGYAVSATASSESRAIAQALETRPQVALVDLAVEDGFDAIEVARQLWHLDVPVLFLTDAADNELLCRAWTARPFGYVLRPIEERQLRLAVDTALCLHEGKTKLVERARHLSRILDHVDAGVIAIDIAGSVTFMNPLAESLLEWRQADLSDVLLPEVFHVTPDPSVGPGEAAAPDDGVVASVLRLGARLSGASATLTTKTGAHPTVNFHAAPLRDAQRSCIGAVLVFQPGTRPQEVEQEMKRTVIRAQTRLRLLENIFDSLSDGVAVADRHGHFIMANQSARDMVGGLSAQGRNVSEWSEFYGVFRPDETTPVPSHELAIARAMRGEATDGAEIFIRNAAKPAGVHLSVSGRPLQKNLEGDHAGVIVMRDITERRATEKKLQETVAELSRQTQLMQAIYRSMSDGVVVADETGRLTLFNPAAERIVGRGLTAAKPDQWTAEYGIFFADKVTPVPPEELTLMRAVRGEASDETELFIRNAAKPQGAYLSVSGRPIEVNGVGRGGVIVFRDVTEKVLAQEALASAFAQGRLEVLDTILHNVGNAINSVAVGSETLMRGLAEDPLLQRFSAFSEALGAHRGHLLDYIRDDPQGQQALPFVLAFGDALGKQNHRLLRAARRVNRQANHIADILRTQRALGRSVTRKDVNLRQAVSNALKILQADLWRRDVRTHLNFGNVPEEIRIEESLFQQMLVNLFKNAMEATDELRQSGGLRGLPRIELRAYERREFLVLDIVDNGVGIARRDMRKIFTPGYTTKPEGSGLGLHSAANFVTGSGGRIQPFSEGLGHGTTMRVMVRLSAVAKTASEGDSFTSTT